MKIVKSNIHAFLFGMSYALFCTVPAYAAVIDKDTNQGDTSIFFSNSSNKAEILPNVLFILDNSGSMTRTISSTGKSRMQTMKDSFRAIMNNTSGINVGLMQFNTPGGPVVFPATDIDKSLAASNFEPTLAPKSRESADDATEASNEAGSSGDGSVDISSTELTFGWDPAPPIGGGGGLYESPIDIRTIANADDAYESDFGYTYTNYNLRLCDNRFYCFYDKAKYMGVRFQDVNIPAGSLVHDAYLYFTPFFTNDEDARFRIRGEKKSEEPFTDGRNKISGRMNDSDFGIVSGKVDWRIKKKWTAGKEYRSKNIKSIIKEIIKQPTWTPNDAMGFIIERQYGSRFIYGYEGSPSNAPRLYIDFTPPAVVAALDPVLPDPVKKVAGIRFQDVGVPQGATITSAYIVFTPSETSTIGEDFTANIRIQNSVVPTKFSTTPGDITSRGGTIFPWRIDEVWEEGEEVKSPDITSVLQPLISRGDWCGNNAIALQIEEGGFGEFFRRKVHSIDAEGSLGPRLVIEYDKTTADESSCINNIVTNQVSSRPDDAQEKSFYTDNNNSSHRMGSNYLNAFRFQDIPVKQGAKILDASLTFSSSADASGSASFTVRGYDVGNATAIPESYKAITNMFSDKTSNSTNWNSSSTPPMKDWVNGGEYETPPLTSIVQEIVDRGDWDGGNAMTFLVSGSGTRYSSSWDSSPGGAAQLRIKVKHGGIDTEGFTVRDHVIRIVDDLVASGSTPIVDTLYEAALYYSGDPIKYGKKRPGGYNVANQRISHQDSYTNGVYSGGSCKQSNLSSSACHNEQILGSPEYASPITDSCQASYVVLLTDGAANNNNSESLIRSKIGSSSCNTSDYYYGERCSPELTKWMAENDVNPDTLGDNNVKTYTIAFDLTSTHSVNYLKDLAFNGGGSYFSASDAGQLSSAFAKILSEILSIDASFVTPGTSVSQFNRLTSGNDIFYSVFRPQLNKRWGGNLKKYEIKDGVLSDANGIGAIETDTSSSNVGFFKATSKSFWSDEVDGPAVDKGGASSQLPVTPSKRNVYTYLGGDLALKSHPVSTSNSDFIDALTDVVDSSYSSDDIIKMTKWLRGEDVFDEDGDGSKNDQRHQYGDPLHSGPVSVTYGGTEKYPDTTIYMSTNEGFLHAVDAATGEELFSFIPQDLFENVDDFYANPQGAHPYGLDGQITPHVIDTDQNGEPEAVYLYFGMRRGGNKYYALDVTDRANPTLMWIIDGDNTTDYAALGETWSQPTIGLIEDTTDSANTELVKKGTPVLIFAGGYDYKQDGGAIRSRDRHGNAIYMVEAGLTKNSASPPTPRVIWEGSTRSSAKTTFPEMIYGMPAKVAAIDSDANGYLDQMYVGDMGGQLWRFDVESSTAKGTSVEGRIIFTASDDLTAANNRRFYNTPDVSILNDTGKPYIGIGIGSGWRAKPTDTGTEDKFCMVRQPFDAAEISQTLTIDDLYNATNDNAFDKFKALQQFEDGKAEELKLPRTEIDALQQELYPLQDAASDAEAAYKAGEDTISHQEYEALQGQIGEIEDKIAIQQAKIDTIVDSVRTKRAELEQFLKLFEDGWCLHFDELGHSGEKVLARSITQAGTLIVTTYQPLESSDSNRCGIASGLSRLYVMSTFNASATIDLDGDDIITRDDRVTALPNPIPAADPTQLIITLPDPPEPETDEDGNEIEVPECEGEDCPTRLGLLTCFATTCFEIKAFQPNDTTYWLERQIDPDLEHNIHKFP